MKLKTQYLEKRHDLHAHTKYSDGAKTIEESIKARLKYADVIGVSDHYRYLISESFKLKHYCEEVMVYRQRRLDKGRLEPEIKLGIEVFFADLQYAIRNLTSYPFDVVIIENFEYFSDQNQVLEGIKVLLNAFEKAEMLPEIILAHPNYDVWFDHLNKPDNVGVSEMLDFLKMEGISLEFNVNTGYFFESGDVIKAIEDLENPIVQILNESGIEFAIGMDCHAYEGTLYKGFEELYDYFQGSKA